LFDEGLLSGSSCDWESSLLVLASESCDERPDSPAEVGVEMEGKSSSSFGFLNWSGRVSFAKEKHLIIVMA
jgi:hypothetical protein